MRPVQRNGAPQKGNEIHWLTQQIGALCDASQEVTEEIFDAYKVTNPPAAPVRTFDASTATVADLAAVLATLIQDMKNRGVNRKASNVS